MKPNVLLCLMLWPSLLVSRALPARSQDGVYYPPSTGEQTETDEYTRYELLDPQTASFKIYYEVTATTAGATVFYNPIRKGSIASDESVFDAMSGKPLHFGVVTGAEAAKDPLMSKATPEMDYIRVELARAVPEHGQGRILIVKTYKDPKSYYTEGNTIVFNRPLGIQRNKIVLPLGYELVSLSVPSQILTEPDGRLAVSFMHAGTGEAPLVLKAIKDAQTASPPALTEKPSWETPFSGETEKERLTERAHGDRDISYFLQQPETHTFTLYHDYTERRSGVAHYVNVVREGSTVANPSAYILDTGESLPTRIVSASELKSAHIDPGEPIPPNGQAVLVTFPSVKAGESLRLRILESYTAPASYRLEGDQLVFDRSLGRPRNAVVLPSGWYCTASAIPGVVDQLPDGRVRLVFWDDQPGPIDVLLKGRRRVTEGTK